MDRSANGRTDMPGRWRRQNGFGLIEVIVLIIVVGILASLALQSMTALVQDQRRVGTEREMEMLVKAIAGDPALTQDNQRCDFGYIGDVGAFPPDLDALRSNPGGMATWNGPYLPEGFAQDSTGYKLDEWGRPYSYAGGINLTSTGGGETITVKVADHTDDYLLNRCLGSITDLAGNSPGLTFADSVEINITIPNGSGGLAAKTYNPDYTGAFALDSLPAGRHPVQIIFLPAFDTLYRYMTILPRHKSRCRFQFASDYFSGGAGPTPAFSDTLLLSTADNATLAGLAFPDEDLIQFDGPGNTVSTRFDGSTVFAGDEDLDAVHITADGHLLLSTTQAATMGGLSFDDEDVVDYDPVTGTATMLFDGSTVFTADEDVDALLVLDNGHIVLSTDDAATIGGLSFQSHDLVEYDLTSGLATLYLDGSSVFSGPADINAVCSKSSGQVILGVTATSQIGPLTFGPEDLVEYDMSLGTASLYFDGSQLFATLPADIDASHAGQGSGTPLVGTTALIRPDNDGSMINLDGSGCTDNYQCVDDIAPDEDATSVRRAANSFATDVYSFEDPVGLTGNVLYVTVACRARKHQAQGDIHPAVYVGGGVYEGTTFALTNVYTEYSHQWSVNPATGVAWTWTDINNLQAGLSLKGQNANFPAYCTQVWVEVTYVP